MYMICKVGIQIGFPMFFIFFVTEKQTLGLGFFMIDLVTLSLNNVDIHESIPNFYFFLISNYFIFLLSFHTTELFLFFFSSLSPKIFCINYFPSLIFFAKSFINCILALAPCGTKTKIIISITQPTQRCP